MRSLPLALLLLGACADEEDPDLPGRAGGEDDPPVRQVPGVVGPGGGVIVARGLALEIPAGALDDDVAFDVLQGEAPPVEGLVAATDVFSFTPGDLTFTEPVTVTLELPAADPEARLFLADGADGFVEVPGSVSEGRAVVATVDRLGALFAGTIAPAP